MEMRISNRRFTLGDSWGHEPDKLIESDPVAESDAERIWIFRVADWRDASLTLLKRAPLSLLGIRQNIAQVQIAHREVAVVLP